MELKKLGWQKHIGNFREPHLEKTRVTKHYAFGYASG
jgi:hypothetical protein